MSVDSPVRPAATEPATAIIEPLSSVANVPPRPRADAAEPPPWPEDPLPQLADWRAFARYASVTEGQIIAGLLNSEGVPAIVDAMWAGLDLTSYSIVWVPEQLLHRARWILSWPAPSEAELTFLATGELPDA